MWRSTKFEENEDLDQSISDEEDLASGVVEDCNFLSGSENKGELHVLSQLEKLRDARELDHAVEPPSLSRKRQADIRFQGRDAIPVFNNDDDFIQFPGRFCTGGSDDEIVSDDEVAGKEHLEQIQNKEKLHSMSELLDLYQGKNAEGSKIDSIPVDTAVEHDHPKISVNDLLDSVHGNNIVHGANSSLHSKTTRRSTCKLGNRNICDDGSAEIFDSGTSSGDEDHKVKKRTNLEFKQKTMTDQFHEAFDISSMNDETFLQFPRQSGIGLFGELQRVIQSEKERDIEFLRKLQTETSVTDEGGCIDVRILSRCLEAKLTVCCCSFIRDEQSSTVIFNPRVCGDVELEPENIIRIHPPWKEINITGNDKSVILSTYFSQIIT